MGNRTESIWKWAGTRNLVKGLSLIGTGVILSRLVALHYVSASKMSETVMVPLYVNNVAAFWAAPLLYILCYYTTAKRAKDGDTDYQNTKTGIVWWLLLYVVFQGIVAFGIFVKLSDGGDWAWMGKVPMVCDAIIIIVELVCLFVSGKVLFKPDIVQKM